MEMIYQFGSKFILPKFIRIFGRNPYYDFDKNESTWVTKEREKWLVKDMTDAHLSRTLRFLENQTTEPNTYFRFIKGSKQQIDECIYTLAFLPNIDPKGMSNHYTNLAKKKFDSLTMEQQLFVIFVKKFPYLMIRREEIRRRRSREWAEKSTRLFQQQLLNQG